MVGMDTHRRLAAIFGRWVGYSRMMAEDEAGTLTALKRHREDVFDPAVAQHSGRIVKLIGDGTLVEFGSVVDAVKCALAIQTAARSERSAEGKITLRVGINLGDVIIEGDDIYGDGVNIAARLSRWRTRAVSASPRSSTRESAIGSTSHSRTAERSTSRYRSPDPDLEVATGQCCQPESLIAPAPKPVRETPSIWCCPSKICPAIQNRNIFE
jgi:class 3 adenylate cyclase